MRWRFCPQARGRAWPPGSAQVETNWSGKNERLTKEKEARRRALARSCPRANVGQIVFFVWVDLGEHKWVILAERRGPREDRCPYRAGAARPATRGSRAQVEVPCSASVR